MGGGVRGTRKSFTDYEKGQLLGIIHGSHGGKYLKILNESTNMEKSDVWLQITMEFNVLVGRNLDKQEVRKIYGRIKADKKKYGQVKKLLNRIKEDKEKNVEGCEQIGQSTEYWTDNTQDINGGISSDEEEHEQESFTSLQESEEHNTNNNDLDDGLGIDMDIKPSITSSSSSVENSEQYYTEIMDLQRKYFAEQSMTAVLQQSVLRSQLELLQVKKELVKKELSQL